MIRELRTSRGFGVHSPFAFSLITEVLRSRNDYYAFDEFNLRHGRWSKSQRHCRKLCRLIFRLAIRFRCSDVEISGARALDIMWVRQMVLDNVGSEHNGEKLYVMCGWNNDVSEDMNAMLGHIFGMHRFLFLADLRYMRKKNADYIRSLAKKKDYGMTFVSSRRFIFVAALPHLPHREFRLRF